MPKASVKNRPAAARRTRRKSSRRRAAPSGAPGNTGAPDHKARLSRLRKALTEKQLDALLVSNPNDIRYLSGFRGEDSALIVTARKAFVVSDFRFQEELQSLPGGFETKIRDRGVVDAIADLVGDLKLEALGLQAEHTTLAMRRDLAKKVGARTLKETREILSDLRVVKDAFEIECIRHAIDIQEKALLATLETIRPGQTELEICARLEFEMKSAGGDRPSFDPIVAAQANGSLPHAVPGATKTRAGAPLLIDWGVRAAGYVSDMTRTFSLRRWPRELRTIYEVVLEAQVAAIDAIGPGVKAPDVDAVARDIIRDAGYGEQFGHSLGHGIGLDVHERPRLGSRSDETLRPGMVVTVEPGVYIPGLGGVRIEDDVLITEEGVDNLSSLPKDIGWATR